MFRPDPRTLPVMPEARVRSLPSDESDAWADNGDEAATLLRLAGAATLAILVLAVASVVLV